MISGAHVMIFTKDEAADRAFLRDVLEIPCIDSGGGWLIFKLPPAELGVHPGEGPTFESGVRHQLTLMCDDIGVTVAELRAKGLEIPGEPQDEGYGIFTTIALPGGLDVMLYEPRHPTAI